MSSADEELRAKVRKQFGEGIPESGTYRGAIITGIGAPGADPFREHPAPTRALAGKRRRATGVHFEAQLDATHEWLTAQGFGHILPHYPPTNAIPQRDGPPKLVYRKGGGPCDYSGHVNVMRMKGAPWPLASDPASRWFTQIPVVFDAKVLDADHASYTHKPERVAQIFHLQSAHQGGACAFILVRVDALARVVAVEYARHAAALLRAKPIKLHERGAPLLPAAEYRPGVGWLWPSLIPTIR